MDNGASSYRRFRDKGDESGLAEIISDYNDGLIFYLTSIVGNIHTAEDLAEDTFVLLGTKKPRDKGKGSFKRKSICIIIVEIVICILEKIR